MPYIERFRPYVGAMLVLEKDNKVLLQRRLKTGYADGWYNPVSGHVDQGEEATHTMVREAQEEAGITIDLKDLELVHVQQLVPKTGDKEFLYLYFKAGKWIGEPKIMEPQKHDDLSWFSWDVLPHNLVPYMRIALLGYKNNILYSEYRVK
jgi:8-oxo-dGTP diphosphatase